MSTKTGHEITKARAQVVVESAPGSLGRDYLIEHVQKALQLAYNEGVIAGSLASRETVERTMVAFWEGVEMQARGQATERRKDLASTLAALGKVTT
jgi:hypothetical protein